MKAIPKLLKPMQALSLDPNGGFICSMIDGETTIEDIIDMTGAPKNEVLRLLDDLVAQGAVSVD